jgi:hypothetical protein
MIIFFTMRFLSSGLDASASLEKMMETMSSFESEIAWSRVFAVIEFSAGSAHGTAVVVVSDDVVAVAVDMEAVARGVGGIRRVAR